MTRRILFAGWPGRVGGAGTESFETQRFFLKRGIEVHCVPTWEAPKPDRRKEVEAMGVKVHDLKPPQLPALLTELGGCPMVTFINEKVLPHVYRIRGISPWIHIPCMTYVHSWERISYKKCGLPDAIVFQSAFQRHVYEDGLRRHGYRVDLGHSIRGAFCWEDWTFHPRLREPNSSFVVGRTARPDAAKWSGQTLKALDPVPNIHAIFMGVDEAIRRELGRAKYAEMLPHDTMPVKEFFARCHAMIAMNGSAKENWPRVGLEAMATGVPVVVDNKWGWVEMVQNGVTGFLCGKTAEFTEAFKTLERDEQLRLKMAENARQSLEQTIANQDAIWKGWCQLFRAVGADHLVGSQS